MVCKIWFIVCIAALLRLGYTLPDADDKAFDESWLHNVCSSYSAAGFEIPSFLGCWATNPCAMGVLLVGL
eukprot:407483-Prorocentrum_minimum.AAC.1